MKKGSTSPDAARGALLLQTYQRLLKYFGHRNWWPADHAWEMMVGAILTQNTNWSNVEKALSQLKAAKALSVRRTAALPRKKLETLIRSSGFFRQKAERLQRFARYMERNTRVYQQLTGQVRGDLQTLRRLLLAMNGIGPETADSMLLYAGGYPVFVVDAYTRRVGQRQGLFKTNNYHEVQAYFEAALPKKAALYNDFHAQIVWLAKHHCKKNNPLCGTCPVSADCAYAQQQKTRSDS